MVPLKIQCWRARTRRGIGVRVPEFPEVKSCVAQVAELLPGRITPHERAVVASTDQPATEALRPRRRDTLWVANHRT
jgi:hypothetical protein